MRTTQVIAAAAAVFGIVAIVHALRLILGWDVYIAGWMLPAWLSFAAVILAGYLSCSLARIKR